MSLRPCDSQEKKIEVNCNRNEMSIYALVEVILVKCLQARRHAEDAGPNRPAKVLIAPPGATVFTSRHTMSLRCFKVGKQQENAN